jgi:hypothetical protein
MLKINGAIPLMPLYTVMAWTGTRLAFFFPDRKRLAKELISG